MPTCPDTLSHPNLLPHYPENHFITKIWSVSSTFFSSSFRVSGLKLRSLIHFWVDFYSGQDTGIKFQSLANEYPVFPSPLVKTFLQCMFVGTLLKIIWLQMYGFISGFSVWFHWFICLFYTNTPRCFCYYKTMVCSKIPYVKSDIVMPWALLVSAQDIFGYSSSFSFHVNFRIIFLAVWRKSLVFWWSTLKLYITLVNKNILAIVFQSINMRDFSTK